VVSTATVTKLLRAKLKNDHDELTKLLHGGPIEVRNAALCCWNFDDTRTRGHYTGRALCPKPLCSQDFLLDNTALPRWSGAECVPHGLGEFSYPNGQRFRGTWHEGRRVDGFGVMVWPDGAIYQGEWRGEQREGPGTFTDRDRSIFTGAWARDCRVDGKARLQYSTGDVYEGEFKNDRCHGEGTTVYGTDDRSGRWHTGDQFVGRWAHDSRADAIGIMYYATGAVYEGEWWDCCKHGHGKFQYAHDAAEAAARARELELERTDCITVRGAAGVAGELLHTPLEPAAQWQRLLKGAASEAQGKIHRVDPKFGSTLT
jgi:hypothetical protein